MFSGYLPEHAFRESVWDCREFHVLVQGAFKGAREAMDLRGQGERGVDKRCINRVLIGCVDRGCLSIERLIVAMYLSEQGERGVDGR